jgi:N-acetylneuraminic acid mutarotase
MRPETIEERVSDYVAAERAAIAAPPLLRSRILHAVEASRPAPARDRLRWLQIAAVVAALLLLGVGIAWIRIMAAPSPAGMVQGTWSTAPDMATGRGYHTATLLANGKVLVVGGAYEPARTGTAYNVQATSTAELYDPASRTWSSAGQLAVPRLDHTATLLRNGKVLVVGGLQNQYGFSVLASAELYNPLTNSWSPAASLRTARAKHTATLLADGRVLVVGGIQPAAPFQGGYLQAIGSAELYDPDSNTWAAVGPLRLARAKHSAVLLADHRVLVMGGGANNGDTTAPPTTFVATNSVELYDPATQAWSAAASMHYARILPTSSLLPDGRVLVVGDSGQNAGTAEIFDPRTGQWSTVPDSGVLRSGHTTAPLRNGNVLVAGGLGQVDAQVFDWRRNAWLNAGRLAAIRSGAVATTLKDGQVLVTGGFASTDSPLPSGEQYDPAGVRLVGITPKAGPSLPSGGFALLGIATLLLGVGFWLGRLRPRWSRQGDAWIDSQA